VLICRASISVMAIVTTTGAAMMNGAGVRDTATTGAMTMATAGMGITMDIVAGVNPAITW
jgi:hypothetical protein